MKKKILKIIGIVVIIFILFITITNIIFNLNKDKYELRSYECCDVGTYPQEIEVGGMKMVITSPRIVEFPCGCSDKDLTLWQKTFLVLKGN